LLHNWSADGRHPRSRAGYILPLRERRLRLKFGDDLAGARRIACGHGRHDCIAGALDGLPVLLTHDAGRAENADS